MGAGRGGGRERGGCTETNEAGGVGVGESEKGRPEEEEEPEEE